MNTTHTLQQMQQLRLQGMHHAYHSQLELPMNQQLEGHDLVAQLVQSEQLSRANEKTAYYLKLAKLRLPATYKDVFALLLPGKYAVVVRSAASINSDMRVLIRRLLTIIAG